MEVYEIIYKEAGTPYYFANKNNLKLKVNDYVIVETENGEQYGKIKFIDQKSDLNNLKTIIRVATKKDLDKYLKNLKESKEALKTAKKYANQLSLNMQFVDAAFSFDHKMLIINFISDERVDFRELVKILAGKYKIRIDLHQIGVRDKAKTLGGIGPCGRCLCCANFLEHLDTISINMAKNQNIALNPNKINGACGRLLCCLGYEDETYKNCRKNLKQVGDKVIYNDKECVITSIDLLNQKYTIDYDGEKKEILVNETK